MADRELGNALSSGELSNIQLGGTDISDKVLTSSEVDAKVKVTDDKLVDYALIDGSKAVEKVLYAPQDPSTIAYVEGTVYYCKEAGTLDIKGKYPDVTLQTGREMHMEVINNTGVTIINGSVCRHNGVAGGEVQIELAQADTFKNAIVLGVATHNIVSGAKGILSTFGIVNDIDTNGLTVGTPIYLSSTVAGAKTSIAPDIATQVGGVLVEDATIGKMFIRIENLINLPNTQAYLQQQNNGVYNLTAGVSTPITDYAASGSLVMTFDPFSGTIQPLSAGAYALNFTFSGITDTERQSIEIEMYDIDTATVLYTHVLPTGRDLDNGRIATSFQVPGNIINDTASLVVRMKPDANMIVTISQCNFSINSLHIR